MIKSHKALGRQALKFAMAGIAVFCLGAAGFAAPMTITSIAKVYGPSQHTSETKTAYAHGKGPAFQLSRAALLETLGIKRRPREIESNPLIDYFNHPSPPRAAEADDEDEQDEDGAALETAVSDALGGAQS